MVLLGQLVPLHGGNSIPLMQDRITIGRAEGCDVVVRHRSISGQHCCLRYRDGTWYVKDLDSHNGVCVGDVRCQKGSVPPGSVIRLGAVRFELSYGPPQPASQVDSAEDELALSFLVGDVPQARRSSPASAGEPTARLAHSSEAAARPATESPAARHSVRPQHPSIAPKQQHAGKAANGDAAGITKRKKPVRRFLGKLTPVAGGDPIPLLDERVVIGRDRGCGIRLHFSTVSTKHCQLDFRDGYWCVLDLGSRNGIRVNGEPVLEGWLMPGAKLAVANFRFEIDYTPKSDEPPPPLDPMAGGSLLQKAGLAKDLEGDRHPDWLKSDQDLEPNKRIDLESM